jgi:hypothetical protein
MSRHSDVSCLYCDLQVYLVPSHEFARTSATVLFVFVLVNQYLCMFRRSAWTGGCLRPPVCVLESVILLNDLKNRDIICFMV